MKRLITLIIILTQLIMMTAVVTGTVAVSDKKVADYLISWQLDNGGWSKDKPEMFTRAWNGKENKAKYYKVDKVTPLGTIDNQATVQQLSYIATVYSQYKKSEYKTSFIKGIEFLLKMQYPTGGFPQVYPVQDHKTSLYENDATYNDDAMANVMNFMMDIVEKQPPYDQFLISKELYARVNKALDLGISYILKSQITVNGTLTAWGGQHDPVTYKTTKGRPFEPISIISKESIGIIKMLERYDNGDPRIQISIQAARKWVTDSIVLDTEYVRKGQNGQYFVAKTNKYIWYRFYDINTNAPLFGDRDGTSTSDIKAISEERRHGYGWAGTWGKAIYQDALIAQGEFPDDDIPASLEQDFDEEILESQMEEELYQQSLSDFWGNLNIKVIGISFGSIAVMLLGLLTFIVYKRRP